MLDNGRFWDSYQLRTSPGDGHCFIYSMVTGIKSLHPSCNISSNDILGRLWEETTNNSDMYIPFIKIRSKESLCNGLKAYVLHKVYNTSFGDLVPQIVVNALEINLIIIHKLEDTYDLNILLHGTVILLMIYVWWFSKMVCIMMVYVMFVMTCQKPSANWHIIDALPGLCQGDYTIMTSLLLIRSTTRRKSPTI